MSFSERTFDRSALILAWLSQREHSNAHGDLRSYHDTIFAAFSKAFGIQLEVSPVKGPMSDDGGLHRLLLDTARSCEKLGSPFSDYLCGTREISEMYQKYGEPFNQSVVSVRNLYLTMMVELIERIWGDDVPHEVVGKDLEACGHPVTNPPDPLDFW